MIHNEICCCFEPESILNVAESGSKLWCDISRLRQSKNRAIKFSRLILPIEVIPKLQNNRI